MQTEVSSISRHLSDSQRVRFRLWLQSQFSLRCQKNPRYSLRAFARTLSLEAATVSQLLSGKRAPSRKALVKICDSLSATPRDLKHLGALVSDDVADDEFYQLSVDTFAVLSDWYYFAILELTFTSQFRSDSKWIARELGMSVQEVKNAIERLKRLGLLAEKNGCLRKTRESLTNHTGLHTSAARKTLQKQVIGKALEAVDEISQEEKDITSITMAVDPKNLDLARKMIMNFRRELCSNLEQGQQSRVYNLAIQLYPVSKG